MVLLQLLVEAVEEDFLPLEGMTRNMVLEEDKDSRKGVQEEQIIMDFKMEDSAVVPFAIL